MSFYKTKLAIHIRWLSELLLQPFLNIDLRKERDLFKSNMLTYTGAPFGCCHQTHTIVSRFHQSRKDCPTFICVYGQFNSCTELRNTKVVVWWSVGSVKLKLQVKTNCNDNCPVLTGLKLKCLFIWKMSGTMFFTWINVTEFLYYKLFHCYIILFLFANKNITIIQHFYLKYITIFVCQQRSCKGHP